MIEQLYLQIAKKIYSNNNTGNSSSEKDNDLAIIQYGIECIFNILIPILIISIFSLFQHKVPEMILWIISFLILRNYIGGYHASSHIKCIIYSAILGVISISSLSLLDTSYITIKIILLTFYMIFFIVNGPILQDQSYQAIHNILFTKGLFFFIIEILIVYILLQNKIQLGNSVFVGVTSSFILYTIELIKRRIYRSTERK